MNNPTKLPLVEIDIVNITKNSKGFRVNLKPIENIENIKSYNIYLDTDNYSIEPDSNDNRYLIGQIDYSEEEKYFYYIPETTGLHYLTIFCQNTQGLESTGILYTGIIPHQKPIKEINIQNLNYYDREEDLGFGIISGGMTPVLNQNSATTEMPFGLIGYQINYISPAVEEVQINEKIFTKDFSRTFRNQQLGVYNRVIPALENNSGILFDQSLLRNYSNDVYFASSLGKTIDKSFSANSISISNTRIYSTGEYSALPPENDRYFIFDYELNFRSFSEANAKFVEGIDDSNTILLNPNEDTSGTFLNKILNATGQSGELPKNFVKIEEPGHYDSYYIVSEVIDEDGFSSAGGNVNNNSDLERYTNQDGYKILKIQHKGIARVDIINMFKNYSRGQDNEMIFDIKGKLPIDIGLNSIIILPQKYQDNINVINDKEYYDEFIFLRNLDKIDSNTEKNYKIDLIDSQNESKYRLTTYLNPDSLLLKDNIFSAKVYYLNSLQANALSEYLEISRYSLQSILYYINNTSLIDKYVTLNKFIKDNKNYTSTIAASYQGLVYFFTPESYPHIAWPNEKYRNDNLNKYGARMLDFDRDGVGSGPQFFDYFPQANAEIDGNFPSDVKYKTTYRCLDSYKYNSLNTGEYLSPEDVPTSGINDSPSYLGVYDPGNIGDVESPGTADFKSINNDLNYFKSKNIVSVKLLSVGIQKEDAYAIVEFILDIPDADDFIVQGISGTDTILEKGIKEIEGVNYHYFVAKFVSSCGIDTDPVLFGQNVDVKAIIDSKKMISFLVYPTRFKVIEDEFDKPFFGDFYLIASDFENNQFNILKECPYSILNNETDCLKGCCVEETNILTRRVPYKQFYILSKYPANQDNNYQFGKIGGTNNYVLGSLNWRYKALDYSSNNHVIEYRKPTVPSNDLNFGIVLYPEHNVTLYKIIVYMKQIDDVNNISWKASDIIDSYVFDDIVKNYPLYISIPDMSFSKRGKFLFDNIADQYSSWIDNQQTFGIRIYMIDKSNDKIEQTFIFNNNESC